MNTATATAVQLRLFDAQGRWIKTVKTNVAVGKSAVAFDGLNLPKGNYQIQVQTESGVQVLRLFIL